MTVDADPQIGAGGAATSPDRVIGSADAPSPIVRTSRRRRRLRLGIQSKLLLMLLVTSVVSSVVVGAIAYNSGRDALRQSAFDRLTAVRESRSHEFTRRYDQLLDSLVLYTRGSTAIDAVEGFSAGFADLQDEDITPGQQADLEAFYADAFVPALELNTGLDSDPAGFVPEDPAAQYLQLQYTVPPADFDAAIQVDDAGDGSAWSETHARYHDYFREMALRFDYEDVLLIDPSGVIVYTAYKGVDLGSDLRTGPFSGTSLAVAFENTMASNAVDYVATSDLERYQPSFNVPTGWVVSPIGEDGDVSGVLAIQIPLAAINEVMTGGGQWDEDGLGDSGETYLVGPDLLMRSTSRVVLEDPERYRDLAIAAGTPTDMADRAARVGGTILIQPVRTAGVERALRGETGTLIGDDYLGRESLAAYAPLELGGLQWVIIAELDAAEAFEPVRDFTRNIVLATAAIILAVSLASLVLSQIFSRPVRNLVGGVRKVAAGELGAAVDSRSRDEFGDLATAFNDMSRSLRTKQDLLEEEQREHERLLLTLMPETVARRYREGEETIAEDHQDVAVLFADLVGFDEFAADLDSAESLAVVNSLVRGFDEAAERLGVERVRTLRNGYLVSCGLVSPRVDSVHRAVEFAVEMQAVVNRFNVTAGASLAVRAGIDIGRVSSGLVGRSSIVYDMWGDAVNLAYQVQATSGRSGIYATGRVQERLRESLTFEPAGEIDTQSGRQTVWRLAEQP